MAEIRCPMCSRLNPEERDVCEFCGARLKPLTGALAAADAEPIHPGEEPTPRSTSELEGNLPEWLRTLRGSEGESGSPAAGDLPEALDAGASGDEGDDFSGRLAALGAEQGSSGEPPTPSTSSEPAPEDDFLSRLAGLTSPGESQETSPAAEGAAGEETADWLAGLSSAQEAEEEETPDWLKNVSGKFAKQTPESPAPAEATGWQPDAEAAGGPAATVPEAEPEGKGFLGETSQPTGEAAGEPVLSEDAPDWLKDLETGTPTSPEVGAGVPGESEETPAWLAGLRGGTDFPAGAAHIAAEGQAGLDATPTSEDEIPDWLKPAAAAGATMSSAARRDEPSPPDETPDWLKELPEGVAEVPAAPAEDEDIPDWLRASLAAGAVSEVAKPEEPLPTEQVPDWLASPPAASEPVSAPPEKEEEGVPDWLKGMAAAGAVAAVTQPGAPDQPPAEPVAAGAAPGEPAVTGEEEKETPAWLKGLAAGAAAGAAASALEGGPEAAGEELFPAALPAWLDEIKPPEAGAPAAPAGQESLAEAELPSWVEAMRPVEAAQAAEEEAEHIVEQRGPLAGFTNVLPAAAGAAVHRVSAYPNKLLVNESQQSQVELLERQISGERTARAAVARRRITSNRMLRWGIAALLLAFVALPIVFQSQVTPGLRLYPPELLDTVEVIDALPTSSTVLVVVDYQPASSGELEAVTRPLLDQLRLRDATVVFVSSTAPGSALAGRLVAGADSDLQQTSVGDYINLGYLTGGASGIANFAADPALAAPHTISGVQAWDLPGLQGLESLSDFNAMVVLTDSSDTGAIWIEQARARLGISPLLLAISAQAEPMLQPYYDSGQVQGMVTGLPGGVAYEQANGISSIGSHYWDGFSVGFLVADFIVAIGGVMALFAAWQSRRVRAPGEAG
jgi:hypothetical protein